MNTKPPAKCRHAVSVALLLLLALPAYAYRSGEKGKPDETVADAQPKTGAIRKASADQRSAAESAEASGIKLEWHPRLGTPFSIRGPGLGQRGAYSGGKGLAPRGVGRYEEDAVAVMDNLTRLYGIRNAEKEFAAKRVEEDSLGFHHVRLTQLHQGLRVFGGEVLVHFDQSGKAYQVNGQYIPDIQVEVVPKIDVDQAVSAAQGDLAARGKEQRALEAKPTLVVFAQEVEPQLAFELTLLHADPKAGPERWRYWIDANSGKVLLRYNDIKTACPTTNGVHTPVTGSILAGEGGQTISVTGWRENTGYYYLNNTNRHWLVLNAATSGYPDYNTCAYRSTNNWGTSDRAEMSAARNFDLIQRYWTEVMGRNSFNNSGANARANVHEGIGYVNAYWDGSAFYFGDGDGVEANSLAVLDVCGHEYAHAVTEYSANLDYFYESGALNESFSDIFGAGVEFYAQADGRALYPSRSPGTADWLCGEDCWLSSVALRDMRNPRNTATVGAGNEQPSRYRGTYWYSGSGDNGGVHVNSGVQNFFFYLLSEGGSGNNDGIVYSVTGIGVTNAEGLASRALTVYCTPNTDYQAVRSAWMSAAMDLNTNWVGSVGAAWSAVGVGALSVAPDSMVFRGPVGGPFGPPTQAYTLFNRGSLPMNWSLAHPQTWLAVSPTNGTIPVTGSNLVALSINTAANTLAMGIYSNNLVFSNSVETTLLTRPVKLLVGQPDYYTELFDASDNDLDFQAWTFTPDGSTSFYSVCREVATNFLTDPTSGTTVTLSDDSYATVTLTGTNTVAIYNRRTSVFYIGSNGYLTMNSGDTSYTESLAAHFNRPRVSALFDDLYPPGGGRISWKQLDDRVAVTFDRVPDIESSTRTNSFQIELFFDGRIRLTYLTIRVSDGLAGLSAGLGLPAGFVESELTSYGLCLPPDDLAVTPQAGFASLGAPGGPFAPPGTAYALSNLGTNALSWAALATQPWVTADPPGGDLTPGATASVTILINTNAQGLGHGTYSACVIFSNAVTAFTQTRCVQLTIAEPALSISDAAEWEGNTGLTDLVFQVGLMPPSTQTVSVAYATSAGTALAGSDYVATNGTLSFTPAQTNRTITVRVIGDTNAEPNETFFVTLSSPMNAALARGQATGTILADDVGPFFDDFEPNIDLLQWSAFGGAVGSTVVATNYGGSISSPNSLWFGAATNRFAASRSLNTTQGGGVDFWLRIASGTSSTWETADLPDEGIVLEYSINGGAWWTEISRYTNSIYTSWTHLTVDIPVAAQTVNTQFRWRQLSNSGTGYDHWALDDVGALVGPRPPVIVTQPASQVVRPGTNVTFCVSASGSLPMSYQWRKEGTNLVNGGRIAGASSACLTISSAVEADGDQYSVAITNAYGSVVSSNATLLVSPLDHFAWSAVTSPRLVGTPFPVTVTAQDEFNSVVSNFTGTVALSGWTGGGAGAMIEDFESGTWPHSPWVAGSGGTISGSYAHDGVYGLSDPEWSYRTDVQIGIAGDALSWWIRPSGTTGGRAYFGFAASASGCWSVVAAPNTSEFIIQENPSYGYTNKASTTQTWQANHWYKVAVDFLSTSSVVCRLYDSDGTTLLNSLTYSSVTGLPGGVAIRSFDTFSLDTIRSGSDSSGQIAISPTNSVSFAGGVWAGNITALQPATNMYLVAADSTGHRGTSTNFDVLLANDLSVTMLDRPDPVAVTGFLTNTITVANSGPTSATAVTATNFLPPSVTFVSATASQGSCVLVGSRVECALGTLAGGAAATINAITAPNVAGQITNLVTVGRAEADAYAGNNSAASVTTVLMPALSIADASVVEGNSGQRNLVFPVQLAPAAPRTVTIGFSTANGTAQAGTDYVATNGTLTFLAGETNGTVIVPVLGDTDPEPNETLAVVLSNAVNAIISRPVGTGTIINDEVPPYVYLRSTVGSPWGSTANETAMNRAFGTNNWQDLRYETVNPTALFSPATTFIFMEGSEYNALELQSFLTANMTAMQNWVAAGGRLFLNAAPNEGSSMNFGFGVTLLYPDNTSAANAADPRHRIFLGPFTPVGVSWTGTSFGHATVSGTNLTRLITNSVNGRAVLGETHLWGRVDAVWRHDDAQLPHARDRSGQPAGQHPRLHRHFRALFQLSAGHCRAAGRPDRGFGSHGHLQRWGFGDRAAVLPVAALWYQSGREWTDHWSCLQCPDDHERSDQRRRTLQCAGHQPLRLGPQHQCRADSPGAAASS